MIDYLELFKLFHIVGQVGILPFTLHSYIESKIRHPQQAQNGAAEVKLFPATQVACNVLLFGALPMLVAGGTAWRFGQFGLFSPGMNNLDGLVLGAGTSMTILLLTLNGVTRRKLGWSYATLLVDLHERTKWSTFLNKITSQDLEPVRRTAWKVLITFCLLIPVICILVAGVLWASPGGTFQFFISGNPLQDLLSIAGPIATSVMPVWLMAAFMVQSAMAATFTRVKVKLLENCLREELSPTTIEKELEHRTQAASEDHWKTRPRMWSSNLLHQTPTIRAEKAETNLLRSGHLFRENGRNGLVVVLDALNRELRQIQLDHKLLSDVIKTGEALTIITIIGFLVFSGYYFWGGLTGVIADPTAGVIPWMRVVVALLMTVNGIFIIWVVCEEGYQLQEQTKKIARLLRKYQQAAPSLSWEETFLMEQTCNSLLQSALKYELGQFLTVDRSTFVTICATIVTNLIVLVQLKTPPSS